MNILDRLLASRGFWYMKQWKRQKCRFSQFGQPQWPISRKRLSGSLIFFEMLSIKFLILCIFTGFQYHFSLLSQNLKDQFLDLLTVILVIIQNSDTKDKNRRRIRTWVRFVGLFVAPYYRSYNRISIELFSMKRVHIFIIVAFDN